MLRGGLSGQGVLLHGLAKLQAGLLYNAVVWRHIARHDMVFHAVVCRELQDMVCYIMKWRGGHCPPWPASQLGIS